MEKLVYLLWAPEGRDRDAFRDLLLRECGPALLERGARGLTINVDDSDGLRQNIRRMLESVTGFLELEHIRCNTMSEYILAS